MPKRGAAALSLTALALALLLNFRTPDAGGAAPPASSSGDGSTTGGGSTATTRTGGSTSSGSSGSSGSAGTSGASGSSGSSGSSGTSGTKTVDGAVINTRYGAVQVEITVTNGQLTDVAAIQLPDGDRRSASISSRAEPVLRSEALSAQSASIDGVSGASYTSEGYAQSLQSALDAAGL